MEVYDTPEKLAELPPNVFVPLMGVRTNTATAGTEILSQVVDNAKRPLPRLHTMDGFMKAKGERKLALVGGGPSLKQHIETLRNFDGDILVCGSPNDYVLEQGIVPKYVAFCDPDAIMAKYISRTHPDVTYLVASGCHEAVFTALEGRNIVLWHCHSDEYSKQMQDVDGGPENYFGVGGGCTIGLRGLSIGVVLGYQDIHFFGFDSCMGENDPTLHHAYNFVTPEEVIGDIYEIKVGHLFDGAESASKTYYCAGYQLAQAEQFKIFYGRYGKVFRPTFYGGGLMEATARVVEEETHRAALLQLVLGMPNMQTFTLTA